jgi:protease secretion system outer membrane protein
VALAAVEAALPAHPQWRFRQLGIDLAREEVRLAEAANAPRLDLTASASRGDSDGVNTVNQVNRLWSAGVQFSMPLYDGGRTDSATRAALALADKAEAELEDTRRNLLNEASRSLRAMATSLQRLQALETALQTAEQLVVATRRSLGAGLRSRTDLVLAERQLAQVRREQRQLVIDHLRHWWRLSALQRAAPENDLPTIENALR